MTRRNCPLALNCLQMGAFRGKACENWDSCNWWTKPQPLPYEVKQLPSGGIYLRVRWFDELERMRGELAEHGWSTPESIPYVLLKADDGCPVLFVQHSYKEGGWERAVLLGSTYESWAAAQRMSYQEFYEFSPEIYEEWLTRFEYYYQSEQI